MAAPRKKTVSAGITYKVIHWALFVLVLFNGFLIYCFERDRRPRTVHETLTIVTNRVIVVTNFLERTSADQQASTNFSASVSRPDDPAFEIELPYRYGLAAGQRYVDIGGRFFSEGSPTSYGVIVRIFPERIALDNGYYIKNHNFNERFKFDHENKRDYLDRDNRRSDPLLSNDPAVVVRHSFNEDGTYKRGNQL